MSWLQSVKKKLIKTSNAISHSIASVFQSGKKIDLQTLSDFEDMLLMSDMGPEIATEFVNKLRTFKFNSTMNEDDIKEFLRDEIFSVIQNYEKEINLISGNGTQVIMLCGVNGNGKTTTAGKLAMQFKDCGMSVMLGACDTFRAAAVEQLQEWGHRASCEVITGSANSDPASVGYRALEAAQKSNIDVLILDTAGRLHNKTNLMHELQKCVNVLQKLDQSAPHEILMVVDSTTGQNAYNQISTFKEIIPISGLIFTKLDSSAKGGVVIGSVKKYGIPICAIGVGEGIHDLTQFNARDFSKAII